VLVDRVLYHLIIWHNLNRFTTCPTTMHITLDRFTASPPHLFVPSSLSSYHYHHSLLLLLIIIHGLVSSHHSLTTITIAITLQRCMSLIHPSQVAFINALSLVASSLLCSHCPYLSINHHRISLVFDLFSHVPIYYLLCIVVPLLLLRLLSLSLYELTMYHKSAP
jgi:hypothetical protein